MKLSEKYGSVFSIQLGLDKMVVLCGYDTIKDALINHAEAFSARPETPSIVKISKGYGIALSNRDDWKMMRKFTNSTLRELGMGKKSIESRITAEAECLIQKFASFKGKPFENPPIINAAVANIILAIALGQRYGYDDPAIQKFIRLVKECVNGFENVMTKLYNSFPSVVGLLPGSHQTLFTNFQKMKDFIKEVISNQKQELDVNDQRTLHDAFRAKQQEEKPQSTMYFHTDNLLMLVSDLFLAGTQTTSTTLQWGLLLMIKYPQIQRKVQDEIDRVIGLAQPQVEHRKQMPYTDAVIHEVQRFGDTVPLTLPHATATDVTFRGYTIPKGTVVMPVLFSSHKDKAYFAKPDEFFPEHFLDPEGNFKKNEAFLPFSLGKRSCAGENMGRMELFLFFTSLLQNFTFHAPPGAEVDLTPCKGFINCPLPHSICAVSRHQNET
ncbi:cytochrome P450 2B11-like [Hyperolius riggenbachi]|uniref:cytochrome P450 2B11-like n=1 Tax=Hyperolius riggenbachi TaxID=752182 RepID=UPI0035A3546A